MQALDISSLREGQSILYLSQSRYRVRKKATEVVKEKEWPEGIRKKQQDLVAAYRGE